MSLPSFSVRRRVTVCMIFLAIGVLGIISLFSLPLDMFPDIESPMVSVITPWPGASSKDIESKVTKTLETLLASTPDLDELSSISRDNVSTIQLKFRWGTNLDEATNNIRTFISQAKKDLPDDVDESMIFRLNLSQMPVVVLAVTSSGRDINEQSDYVEDHILNDLKRLDGVATVSMFNQRQQQLLVEVDRQRMEAYNLSLQQVGGALRANNLTLPAGTLDIGRSVYTIRAPGEYTSISDVENIIVGQQQNGLVYLKNIAQVRLGIEEETNIATLNGQSALLLLVQRSSGANTVEVARAVKKRIEEIGQTLPSDLQISVAVDLSESVVRMIDSLSETIWVAIGLVSLVVLFFLRRWRSSLIVVLSIPASLVAAFAMFKAFDYTLNVITLASLVIAIGLVVDDSIVVIDNIVRHLELRKKTREAAVQGASEVSSAVTAATLTNMAIFMPILFVGGIIGIMFRSLAFVIIITLIASLLVALMLVPVLSQRFLRHNPVVRKENRFWHYSEKFMQWLEAGYGWIIRWALANRKKVVALAIGIFASSLLIIRIVGVDFIPKSDGGTVTVRIELPVGTNMKRTTLVAKRIEKIIREKIPESTSISIQAGASKNAIAAVMGNRQGDNIASITCRVVKRAQRKRSTFEMAEQIRPEIDAIPDIVSLELEGTDQMSKVTGGGGKPVTIEIYSITGDIPELRKSARHIKEIMLQTPGAVDVTTDLMDDTPELQLSIDRLAAAQLGVPVASIAAAVRTSIYGNVETRYRGGTKDIDLFLRLREADRQQVTDLAHLTVPSLNGAQIRLASIAKIVEGRNPIEVRRLNQQRTLRVMANVSGRPLGDVARDIERSIAADQKAGKIPADIASRFSGDVKEQRIMVVSLSIALILSILLVYMVMAAQFESLLDPAVVLVSIPFGITGALIALPLTGTTISVTSFIGMIMLIGIVVKNAIVLVDYINLMRERGLSLEEAIQQGGERRLRPVLMTALAILGGMVPLAMGGGEGSETWRPMAIAVIGGVSVSTVVTLVLLPSIYALTDRWRKRGKEHEVVEDNEIPMIMDEQHGRPVPAIVEQPISKLSEI